MDDQFTEWHSVRPWHPTLSLAVREITSVSVTFLLSCPYSAADASNQDPASLGLSSSDDDDQSRESVSATPSINTQVVADILAKGLSVKVNGTPWQRVFLKMDDVFDEGIIILYGLMPARQYDIELGLSPGQAGTSVRGQITTDTEALSETALPDANPDEAAANSSEASMSSAIPLSTTPPHGNGGVHTPGPPPTQFTLEDHRQQLTHQLNQLNAEHSSLTSSLKSARKESQKADAALRSEIDTLKRASDRYAAGESRARKKILALQQAVKQTLAAARDIEALVKDIEAALPGLEQRRSEVEKEWAKVKEEAKQVKARREEAERKEKARAETAQAELAGLANRLDKLNGKREKLEGEGGVLAELEEKLRKLEEERERIERDPYGYEGEAGESEDSGRVSSGRSKDDSSPEGERPHALPGRHHNPAHGPHPHLNNFHPQQHQHPRKRHSHPHMHNTHAHHPRPSFPPPPRPAEPVHRPPGAGPRASFPMGPSPNPNAVPGVIHLPPHPPHGPNHAHRKQHRGAFPAHGHGSGSGSSSASPTPVPNANLGAGTGLSSRAPPFEPSRSRAHSQSQAQPPARSELNPGSTPFAPRTAVAPGKTTLPS